MDPSPNNAAAIAHPAPPPARAAALSFDAVYEEYSPFVWRSLRRLGVPDADLPDVCQEVFVVVHRKLARYDGSSSVRTWLFGILWRASQEYRRRPHRRHESLEEARADDVAAATQIDEVERRRARAVIDAILDQLDDGKRAVFVLYEFEELPMSEVAQAVGCPVQTAYSRLHAARRHVTTALRRAQARGQIA